MNPPYSYAGRITRQIPGKQNRIHSDFSAVSFWFEIYIKLQTSEIIAINVMQVPVFWMKLLAGTALALG
jgi:hypothetical protein